MVFIARRNALGTPKRQGKFGNIMKREQLWQYRSAQQLIEYAQHEADTLRETADEELEFERKRGLEQGMKEAHRAQADLMAETLAQRARAFAVAEKDALQLVMSVLRTLCGEFERKERVHYALANAMASLRSAKHALFKVHPDDIDAAHERVVLLKSRYPLLEFVDVDADSRVQGGCCILETDLGTVQVDLNAQLDALEKTFEGVMHEQSIFSQSTDSLAKATPPSAIEEGSASV